MVKNKKDKKRIVHSISFEDETFEALKKAAEEKGLSFAAYIKSAALNFTQASIQHEQLLESINANDMTEGQKTFNEAISDLREVLNHTVINSSETLNARLGRVEKLIRLMIYVQLYYSRELPPEAKSAAQISAKTRMEQLLKDIDTEPVKG